MPDPTGLDDAVGLLRALPDREAFLRSVLGLLRRWTGCQAVGVRLARDGDYPYFSTQGFAADFVRAESRLCDGDPTPVGLTGRTPLACMCGAVIDGRLDQAWPFATAGGSFFTGSTSRLLAGPGELPFTTRNRCNAAGYETVALVPLRVDGRCLGLIQVNDRRRDRLGREGVAALERLADGVALVLSRQEADQALAAAEVRYRAMFSANIAVKLLIDPETGRIVEANPAACDFYGYPPEIMETLSIWDINILGPEKTRAEMRAAQEEGRRFFRFTHRLADGSLREVEVYSGPVAFPGRTLLFSIIHDVTDRVRAEQARERVEQMLRHDLRSPLAGIVGLSAHLVSDRLCPEGAAMAEVIRETAERLYTMVERNLDLLKIEQGRYVLAPEPVELAPLLRRLEREKASLAGSRKLTMRFLGPGLDRAGDGPTVLGEAGLLAAMFANLLANALEAAPAGSTVTVALSEAPGEARIALHNQGVVPEDIRPRFFAKYATSGKKGGTGLGAFLARSVARLHGGDIGMETGEGLGTRLTVRLPVTWACALDQAD
ncbi:MAG: ATP-binding protein [Solidesulfovibrio sp.]|uniref:PAS domain-containing sensor histidine kinase n=1 Tax=Solidesulfovibrio sp. TaxID=2910990 RepID=UPI002B20C1D7|nr:ATP-binding protein [Solidesulfovibrio sp.]MEA4858581.1 PAS domain S-box protein [Solidesulfovibrio sp.]